jgi:polygalacturonase
MFEQKTGIAASISANLAARRTTIRRSLGLAGAALAFSLVALPASAANWWSTSPSVSIGSKIISVRTAGAKGDGRHDDTSAFQSAINSLPSSGGTITVPAGTYMIDAVRSINMRSHVRLRMSSGAKLVALPNSSQRSNVIKVSRVTDVEITGGAIVGERARHRGTSGEWGMGINILASRKVYVHDLRISDCWGDGLYIGAIGSAGHATASTDVTVKGVVSTNNRRQGLSFGPVSRVYVYGSTFSNTHGTNPEAGIDVEPSVQGTSSNIRIEKSTVTGNAGSGLELQAHVTGLTLVSSTIKGNKGFGVYNNGVMSSQMAGNLITENGLDGIAATSASHDLRINSNKVTYNSTRWFIANRKSIYTLTSSSRDLQISRSARNISLSSNTLSPRP